MKYFGGVEGGATHSVLIICNELGECVSAVDGLGTNHWVVGIPECATRIADMVARGKAEANIPADDTLDCLGLSLSGCEQAATNLQLEEQLRTVYPNVAEKYVVSSDTLGSMFTVSANGGIVIISGTGSNCLLRNPDGTTANCGGWGHFLGDEGSAAYISRRALKIVFDDMDNFEKSPAPIDKTWALIQQHFGIETRLDMLTHCYAKFDKPFFSGLCKKLAALADDGDKLALSLFQEAGVHLARMITALLPSVQHELVQSGEMIVSCVGSVWKSWNLLKDSFCSEMQKTQIDYKLKLVRITSNGAYGACYMAADATGFAMPRSYADNFQVIYMYDGACELHTNGVLDKCDCST